MVPGTTGERTETGSPAPITETVGLSYPTLGDINIALKKSTKFLFNYLPRTGKGLLISKRKRNNDKKKKEILREKDCVS